MLEIKNEPEWLKQKRMESFEEFKNLNFKNIFGLGILLDVSAIDFDSITQPKTESIKVESGEAEVMDIYDALKTHDLKEYLFSTLGSEKISSLHKAFFNKGLFIRVPKGIETKIHLNLDLKSETSFEHIIIFLEPLSKLEFVESNTSEQKTAFRSQIVEIFAGEGSIIDYAAVQEYPKTINSFVRRNAVLERDATINWVTCDLGGLVSKTDMKTILKGQGSSVTNKNLFFGSENQQFGLSVDAIHESPNTSSDLSTKGALTGKSKGLYTGLIKICDNASNSVGYQKEDVLQLSDEAEANAIPNLEIGNEEVKCSHGATTGQVDKNKVFYMMSRGIPEEEAKNKIVEGFFEPLIESIPVESLRESIRKIIDRKLRNDK